jgi:ABC-type sugar transport system ATPase subunit
VAFNLSLSVLTRLTRAGLIDPHAEARANQAMARTVRLRAPGPEAPVGTLSGGNQQKLLLGRALLADPRVVLLDEPTRGIDVAARHEVYEEINELTRGGKAVVMASSDLPELLGMSDRLLVLRQGRVAGAFPREEFAPERILAVALGHDPGTPT